jgi:hypothetical protein
MSFGANYNGKQPNNTAYIKNFVPGSPANLWKTDSYTSSDGVNYSVITTNSSNYESVYIPGNLFVDGNIINPSDINLKENISLINIKQTNKLLNIKASQFTFKGNGSNDIHYGFIAQEFENEYPELVTIKPDKNMKNIKAINYLEIIPLLVSKIQMMQKEIDELREELRYK